MKKTILKNIAFGALATVSLASVGLGAVSFLDYANTNFTGKKPAQSINPTPEQPTPTPTPSAKNWVIRNGEIIGYNGILPEVIQIPETYSLGELEEKSVTLNDLREFSDWQMSVNDLYNDAGYEDDVFEYTFTDATGTETICTNKQSIDNYYMAIQEYQWSNEELFNTMFPITVTYEESPIISGTDYLVTKISMNSISQNIELQPENVKEIVLPASVTDVGTLNAYSNFANLEKFVVDEENQIYYATEEGILVDKATNAIKAFPSAITGDYVMPDNLTFSDDDTTAQMFKNSQLTSFTTNDSLETIPYGLFNSSSIDSVILGSGVKTIKGEAFYLFAGSVQLNEGLEIIESSAFNSTTFETINLPSTLTTIGMNAFSHSALTEITVPASVTSLGEYAFYYCESLVTANINGQIVTLENATFDHCSSLANLSLPNTLKRINQFALRGTAIETFVAPEGLEYIDYRAFGTNAIDTLKVLDLPSTFVGFLFDSAYHASSGMFSSYSDIETIVIRKFSGVVRAFDVNDTNSVFSSWSIGNKAIQLYVPASIMESYQSSASFSNATILDLSTYIN